MITVWDIPIDDPMRMMRTLTGRRRLAWHGFKQMDTLKPGRPNGIQFQ